MMKDAFITRRYVRLVKKQRTISKELDWKDYGGKHYESVFTRFYQGYVLPKKFNIDKRKAHWSALICSGQATREEALKDLSNEPYPVDLQNQDAEYVTKKLDFSQEEFQQIMNAKPIPHDHYDTEHSNDLSWKLFNIIMALPVRVRLKLRHIAATGRWR